MRHDHLYSAFGLTIVSELSCPELVPGGGDADVAIREGPVPEQLPDPVGRGVCFETEPGQALVAVPGIARYLVRDAKEIVIDRAAGADDDSVRLILLTTCLGILLQQRGELVLHASTVAHGGRAVALAGLSSVGKSTLAAAFVGRGWTLVADEATCVTTGPAGIPLAVPGAPSLLLWRSALDQLGLENDGMRPARPGIDKYAFPFRERFASEPQRLTDLCVLAQSNREEVDFRTLTGFARFRTLLDQTFREPYLEGLGLARQRQARCSALVPHVQVHHLTWPQRWTDLDEAVELIERVFFADSGVATTLPSSVQVIHAG